VEVIEIGRFGGNAARRLHMQLLARPFWWDTVLPSPAISARSLQRDPSFTVACRLRLCQGCCCLGLEAHQGLMGEIESEVIKTN
jgi:hypothetical protein